MFTISFLRRGTKQNLVSPLFPSVKWVMQYSEPTVWLHCMPMWSPMLLWRQRTCCMNAACNNTIRAAECVPKVQTICKLWCVICISKKIEPLHMHCMALNMIESH